MRCIKTGAVAYVEPYDVWVYGDAFEANGLLILRVAGQVREPGLYGEARHFTVINADHWFDMDKTSMRQNSTLIVRGQHWQSHGYDGIIDPKIARPDAPPTSLHAMDKEEPVAP